MASHFFVKCLDCGFQGEYTPVSPLCPKCSSPWREACYDYANAAATLPHLIHQRPFNIWRYHELLPLSQPNYDLSMGEGGTPLLKAFSLGSFLGCPNIYIKDERQGPTNSFKDRQAIVTIAALKEAGITEMVLASTGNVAISYSAFAARAGIKVWAFLTSLVPAAKMREVALYGTQVIKVTGSYDQAKQVAADFARQRGLFIDQGSKTIPSVEAMKTIAFELSEQLAMQPEHTGQENPGWHAPDWYLQSVSGGLGPLGVVKGFRELRQMGWIDHLPKMGIVQAEGCSPMVHAWENNLDSAIPVISPRTVIATLATGDPGRTYTLLRQAVQGDFGGAFTSVSDDDAYKAMHFLAKMEGISAEPAAAVAFAGLFKLVQDGIIKPDETVVINCTGHTLPVEETILGPGWSRNMVIDQEPAAGAPEEGLLSALTHVEAEKYPRVLIADDQPEVRQLIRRILQSQGKYTLFEAADGIETVSLARKEHPDLLILDLMMPEMDGFSVIDLLQSTADTLEIPIIVITAKELTQTEKNRLKGRIQTLMQKGDLMSDELLEEVKSLVP